MLTNRAIRLLERASINQGMKFDHPSSVKDIDIFMRYYKIDTVCAFCSAWLCTSSSHVRQ
jgi:hypothetical protein